jgi:hypothetical protein
MPGGVVDAPGVLDPNHLIGWRMENEQGPAQVSDLGCEVLATHVVEELLRDGEPPPSKLDLRLSVPLDRRHICMKARDDVLGVRWRRDGHHRLHGREVAGHGQHSRAPEGMSDQKFGRAMMLGQISGRASEILQVRRESCCSRTPHRGTEPREVEAQHGNAAQGEFGRDPLRCKHVLGAGEAMRKQGVGAKGPSGRSSRAASGSPPLPLNVMR